MINNVYGKSQKKITIAVMKFQANNCPPSTARAVSDILAGKIFNAGIFTLQERNQMDLIIRRKRFSEDKCKDDECAARLGKILSVKKMVTGSVNKLGGYKIEIRVINVSNSRVDISISEKADDEEEIEEAIDGILLRMKRFYKGYGDISGDFDISLSASGIRAMGDFNKGAGFGYGAHLNVFINRPFNWKIPVIFITGFYSFIPEMDSIKSLYMVPLEIHVSYPVILTESVKFNPSFGAGYIISRMEYDEVEKRTTGDYIYNVEYFYNPVITLRSEFNLMLSLRWFLVCTPYYSIFFESSRIGQIMGLDIGTRLLF